MVKKTIMFLSIFLILLATLGVVSSNEDIDNQTLEIQNEDLIEESEVTQTFDDIQNQINQNGQNMTVELEGTYEGSGTPIKIEKSIIIQGKGQGATLDAKNLSSIFTITADNVTIKNINFINAQNNGNGGAINWRSNGGQIINSKFINTHAVKSGGAIYLKGSDMEIANCEFRDCTSQPKSYQESSNGGMLYLTGKNIYVKNSKFIRTHANYTEYVLGAAIYLNARSSRISNVTFANVKTSRNTLHIYSSKDIEIIDSKFINCSSEDIMETRATVGLEYDSNLNFTNCEFINISTTITGSGGAFRINDCNFITVNKCTFLNNSAQMGGGIYLYGTNNSIIKESKFLNSKVDYSMIYFGYCNNTLFLDNLFENINCDESGGIFFFDSPYTTIINNTFNNFSDAHYKKAITEIDSHYSRIINCTFSRDSAISARYAEIIKKPAEIFLEDMEFEYAHSDIYSAVIKDKTTGTPLCNKKIKLFLSDGESSYEVYSTSDENGIAMIDFSIYSPQIEAGIWNATADFYNNDNYQCDFKTITVKVNPTTISINVNDIELDVGTSKYLNAEVTSNFNLVRDKILKVYIDDELFDQRQLRYESCDFNSYRANKVGNSTVKVVYEGNKNILPCIANATIISRKIVSIFPSYSQYTDAGSYGDESCFNYNVHSYNYYKRPQGMFYFFVNGVEVGSVEVKDGFGPYSYLPSSAGTYNLTIKFRGNENFTDCEFNTSFTVSMISVEISFEGAVFNSGDYKEIPVLLKDVKGKLVCNESVRLELNGEYYYGTTNSQGIALINVTDLKPGTYSAYAYYRGNKNYYSQISQEDMIIVKIPTEIKIESPQELFWGIESTFNIGVLPQSGTITDGTLKVHVNGSEVKSLEGQSVLNLKHIFDNPGKYNVTVVFNQSGTFEDSNKTIQVTVDKVPSTISFEDIPQFTYGDEASIQAILSSVNGKVDDGYVEFYINDEFASRVYVGDDLKLSSILAAGDYRVTAKFKNSTRYADSINNATFTVNKMNTVLTSADYTFYNDEDKEIGICLKDVNDISLEGIKVMIVLSNGNNLTGITDLSGFAKFNLTALKYGVYTFKAYSDITQNYINSSSLQYSIIVKTPVQVRITPPSELIYSNMSIFNIDIIPLSGDVNDGVVKFYIDGTQINSTVLNGKTDVKYLFEKIGTFNVSVDFAQSKYFENSNATIQVTVEPMPTVLIVDDMVFNQNDEKQLHAKLTDLNGVEISKNIRFNITDSKGEAVTELKCGEYFYKVIFDGDEYYQSSESEIKTIIVKLNTKIKIEDIVNALSLHQIKFSANLSDDENLLDSSQLHYFIDNQEITGNFTPLKIGTYNLTVVYNGDKYHSGSTSSLSFNVGDGRTAASIEANSLTTTYGDVKYLKVILKSDDGKLIGNAKIEMTINGITKSLTTNDGGEASLLINQNPNKYDVKIIFNGNDYFKPISTNIKVMVKKATPKLVAKSKTFKSKVKTKKYSVVLKTNKNKGIKKIVVTLKVKSKTYKAKTNSNGKAVFKLKKLTKKGKYKPVIKFAGNKYYNAVNKKVKITVK